MGEREETYRTYGDYRRAKSGGGGDMKRERKAPPRYLDLDVDEPTSKRFRGDVVDEQLATKAKEDDEGFQPSMMSFKAFLETQDDSITDEEALLKYGEYKQEFRRQQLNEFFVCHKEEEWFRVKYHPAELVKRRAAGLENLQRRLAAFRRLVLDNPAVEDLRLTSDREAELIRLLDSIVVCLEGGDEEDLAHVARGTADSEWACLHKTASIHLRSVPAAATKAELEALGRHYPGFLRVALSEPAPDRRWQRKAWLSFKRDAKVKEICYSLANTKLRDTDLGPVLNKDLSQRVRPVSLLSNDKRAMRRDVRLAAALINRLDAKWGLWEMRQNNELLGAESTNPVVQNITEYLIEEASAEEEELLGASNSSREEEAESRVVEVAVDEAMARVLDRMLLYLRVVHSVDYYSLAEYTTEEEMPNRCGILHVRDGLTDPQQVSPAEIEDYADLFEKRARGSLLSNTPDSLPDQEAARLGLKVEQDELEKFIQGVVIIIRGSNGIRRRLSTRTTITEPQRSAKAPALVAPLQFRLRCLLTGITSPNPPLVLIPIPIRHSKRHPLL